MWKVVYNVQIQCRECRKLLKNGLRPIYSLAEAIPGCIYIIIYDWAIYSGKYADEFYHSMIDDKDGHIPLPLFMLSCTALRHALLGWQMNKSVHPNASKSKLKVDRPDHSNFFNNKKDGGKNPSCWAALDHELLTLPGMAATYAFMMNTWKTLPESYQQRVYKFTLATVKRQIQTGGEPNMWGGNQHQISACWQCYSSWLYDLRRGAWGAWDRKHRTRHPDRNQLHGWWTALRYARGQLGLERWRRWKRQAKCHTHG